MRRLIGFPQPVGARLRQLLQAGRERALRLGAAPFDELLFDRG